VRQPIRKQAELFDRGIRENIHRAARHVKDQVQDPVFRQLDPELLQLRGDRHRFLSTPIPFVGVRSRLRSYDPALYTQP